MTQYATTTIELINKMHATDNAVTKGVYRRMIISRVFGNNK